MIYSHTGMHSRSRLCRDGIKLTNWHKNRQISDSFTNVNHKTSVASVIYAIIINVIYIIHYIVDHIIMYFYFVWRI